MPKNFLSPRSVLGLASIAAGVVLTAFFWGLRIFWFQGGPLGIVLICVGALDLWESKQRGSRGPSRGLLQELRDDLMGPTRGSGGRHDRASSPPELTGSDSVEKAGLDREDSPRRH